MANEMFFDWTPMNPTTQNHNYQPTTTALTRRPQQKLPTMAEVLRRQYGANRPVIDLGYNYTEISSKPLTEAVTSQSAPITRADRLLEAGNKVQAPITNHARMLGTGAPARNIHAFKLDGKCFLVENGRTIGCFDKLDEADWSKEIKKLKKSGANIISGQPAGQAPTSSRVFNMSPKGEANAATQLPATQAPATQAPATQAPATQAPATQAPATQAPAANRTPATPAVREFQENWGREAMQKKVDNYRKAMEKQGLKGQQLEQQVARYEEGLQAERAKALDKIKGKNKARRIAAENGKGKLKVKPRKAKGFGGAGKFFNGKGLKGKAGWIAAALLAAGALLGLSKCSGDEDKVAPVTPGQEETPDVTPVTPAPVEPDPEPAPDQPDETTPVQPEPAPVTPAPVEPTKVFVENNQSIEAIAKKYGVTVEQIKELNADKIRKFHNSMDPNDKKVYEGFRVGEEITLPEGTQIGEGGKTAEEAKKDYEKAVIDNWNKFVPERRNEIASEEFQRKNKLNVAA